MEYFDEVRFLREVSRRLQRFREIQEFTQTDMAKLLKVNQSTYSQYENGQRKISLYSIYRLVFELKLNVYWLFTGDGDMEVGDVQKAGAILAKFFRELEFELGKFGLKFIYTADIKKDYNPKTDPYFTIVDRSKKDDLKLAIDNSKNKTDAGNDLLQSGIHQVFDFSGNYNSFAQSYSGKVIVNKSGQKQNVTEDQFDMLEKFIALKDSDKKTIATLINSLSEK